MKSTTTIILVIVIGFNLFSCTKENDSLPEEAQTLSEDILKSGTWKIIRFEDSGKDETSHFSAYVFIFSSNNKLNADNGMKSLKGSWSITDSNSDDDSQDDLGLVIHFSESNDFEELNEDWDFISYSQSFIELIHVSGGSGSTDYLSFKRE